MKFSTFYLEKLAAFAFLFCFASFSAFSQGEKPASPAKEATGEIDDVTVTVNYSSPSVKGRTIWGDLVPYGDVWRTGANEATVIKFDEAVKVEGKSLAAGEYALFTVPNKDKWTIIFNKTTKQWGAYKYDKAQDALRVEVTPEKSDEFVEGMTFEVNGDEVALLWENLMVPIAIESGE